MDDNWIVENLEGAFHTWNEKLTEIWSLVSETPQQFKGGAIWDLAQNINAALQAVGYGLLILFFASSIFRSTANFQDFRRPEHVLRYFIRFVAAKAAVTYGMDIMTTLFTICAGIVSTVAGNLGSLTGAAVTLPEEIKTAIGEVGFLASIPLWLVTILGSVFITVLSFVMILTVHLLGFCTHFLWLHTIGKSHHIPRRLISGRFPFTPSHPSCLCAQREDSILAAWMDQPSVHRSQEWMLLCGLSSTTLIR